MTDSGERAVPGSSESGDLGDEFAAFADELREQAEMDLMAGLEGWPDDDWTDL